MARLGGTALFGVEEAFGDAVFEAVEGDDREPPTLPQQSFAGKEAFDQLVEFGVHGDAERLETAGGRMVVARLAADGLFDEACQLRGRRDRFGGPGRNDELSDAA